MKTDEEHKESLVEDKKPIPLKWVMFSILGFMVAYHLFMLLFGQRG